MMSYQKGFTLIELMIILMIISVLAAIAVPSYERYKVKNAESRVKAQMGQLELQLESWRAKALSYKGFMPIKGKTAAGIEYGYEAAGQAPNTVLYVPFGSSQTNYEYLLEIVDADSHKSQDANGVSLTKGQTLSLVPPTSGTNINTALGRGYRIVAYPNTQLGNKGARKFALGSDGYRCAVREPNFGNVTVGTTVCTGVGTETW